MQPRALTSTRELPRAVLGLALGATLACGDGPALCPDDNAFCGCACFEKRTHEWSEYYATDYVETLCSDDALCPVFTLTCGQEYNGEVTPCTAVDDPDALVCTLDALARGAAGRLQWKYHTGLSRYTTLHIDGDGTVFRVERTDLDTGGFFEDTARFRLADSEFFEECAAAATIAGRSVCLRDPFSGPAEELCIASFTHNSLYLPEDVF